MTYPKELATHLLGVGGVVIHNNKVLLIKHRYGNGKKFWLIPGGLVEKGETLEEALIREIKEETSLDVTPNGVIGIRSMVRNSDLTTDVYTIFSCQLHSDPNEIKAQDSEISDISWFDIESLQDIEGMSNYTLKIISTVQESKSMIRDRSLDQYAKKRIGVKKYEQYWTNQ